MCMRMALSMSNDTESPIPWRAVQLALLTFDAWQRCRNQVKLADESNSAGAGYFEDCGSSSR